MVMVDLTLLLNPDASAPPLADDDDENEMMTMLITMIKTLFHCW